VLVQPNVGASALVLQPDGKLVAAGGRNKEPMAKSTTFEIARFDKDGHLDK
jgi:hypothetical protein